MFLLKNSSCNFRNTPEKQIFWSQPTGPKYNQEVLWCCVVLISGQHVQRRENMKFLSPSEVLHLFSNNQQESYLWLDSQT